MSEITNEQKVACAIRTHNVKKQHVYFDMLLKQFKDIDVQELSQIINNLYDSGKINGTWESINKKWIRCFFVTQGSIASIDKIIRDIKRDE